ncbi:MAG: 4-hydroxymandelate oxidase [Thermodesulfobacteriota bacterium]|nr:4-hydroxymandelate oxidase [Thermodesulfobacteriota bacterium]
MKEIRRKAKIVMEGFCRICPSCNGKACAGEMPGMGGIGTGTSFSANIEALSSIKFNMRLIHDACEPVTKKTVLGYAFDIPVLAAPIGGVSFNMGDRITEKDYITAVLGGCHETGTLGCTGDGAPDIVHEAGLAAIRELNGKGIPFIKPWEDKELFLKLGKAVESKAEFAGMDIDAAGLITLKLMGRPVSPKSPEKLKEIIDKTPLKFILKGIMTVDDAKRAVDAGAAGIVVSNHGGRVLDHTPGVADVLPEIAKAVKGSIAVIADGGIRTGGDVLKMLALGADLVMIGRPFSIAATGGLKDGVKKYLGILKAELIQTMILTGCRDTVSVDRSILFHKP